MKKFLLTLIVTLLPFTAAMYHDVSRAAFFANDGVLPTIVDNALSSQLTVSLDELGKSKILVIQSNVPVIQLLEPIKVFGRCINDRNKVVHSIKPTQLKLSNSLLYRGQVAYYHVNCTNITRVSVPSNLGLGTYNF